MDACDSARLTVGVPSSSVIVSVFEVGLATDPPFAVPATVTVVFGASTSLFVAVIVTVPVDSSTPPRSSAACWSRACRSPCRWPWSPPRPPSPPPRTCPTAPPSPWTHAAVLTDGRVRQRQAHRRRAVVVRDRQRLRGRIGDGPAVRGPRHRHRRVRRVHVIVRRRDRHRAGRLVDPAAIVSRLLVESV